MEDVAIYNTAKYERDTPDIEGSSTEYGENSDSEFLPEEKS
jgi:hypothetical protein